MQFYPGYAVKPKFTGSEIDLREIIIQHDFQHKGLGKILINEFLKDIKLAYSQLNNKAMRFVVLQVLSGSKLIGFYQKCGFRKIAERYPHPDFIKHDLMEVDVAKIFFKE